MNLNKPTLLGLTALALACSQALAQENWPTRPVKLVVAQAAGGGVDMLARVVATELNTLWQQPVIVENKPGAAGGIAAAYVARSPADGYTLLIGSAGIMTIAPFLGTPLPYAPEDFVPLSHLGSLANVLVVDARSGIRSLADLVAASQRSANGLNSASLGPGSTGQIAAEMLERSAGIQTVTAAYKGESQAVTDLRGGHIDFMAASMPVALAQVRSGDLMALAVTSAERSGALPDVPTMQESGFPDYEVTQWYALFTPRDTPAAVRERIADAARKLQDDAGLRRQIVEMGMEPTTDGQRDFPAFYQQEQAKWEAFMRGGQAR